MAYQFLTLILLSFSSIGFSQEIFEVENRNDADYLIYVTQDVSEADWVIMKTEWRNQAKNGVWYFTEWNGDADVKVYFTLEKTQADKLVFYTEWSTNIVFK